jgi:flagellar protein FliO/FliZ
MESFALSFASMVLALALVLALAWGLLRLLRGRLELRGGRGGRGGEADEALRYVRGLAVGAKERIVIVEHRGARWMLGVTAGGISTLAHWPPGDAAAAPSTAAVPAAPIHAADAPAPAAQNRRGD